MSRSIVADDEQPVTASGGTLNGTVVFNRQDATYDVDSKTLSVPTDSFGTYVFVKDPKHDHQIPVSEIDSVRVGPIFHLPTDLSDDDSEMEQLLDEYGVVLLVEFATDDGRHDNVHYVLDNIE